MRPGRAGSGARAARLDRDDRLAAATRRAIRANRRGLPNDSRYSAITSVPSSCSHHWSRSLLEMSARSPIETKPRARCRACGPARARRCRSRRSARAARRGHRRARERANVALSRGPATPRQFGPIRRMPVARQKAASRRRRSVPSASSKPAETTSSAATPCAAQSRATASTACAGTATQPAPPLGDVEDRLAATDREHGPGEALAKVRRAARRRSSRAARSRR